MGHSSIDLTVVSAHDLKSFTFFGKSRLFVVAFVHPSSQRRTKITADGGRTPVWKEQLDVPVDDSLLQAGNAVLTVKICSEGGFGGDKTIGSVHIPLSQISKDGARTITTYQVRRPSGRAKGSISIIANVVGETIPQDYPTPPVMEAVYPPPVMEYVYPPPIKDPARREDSVYPPTKNSAENPVVAYPAYGFNSNSDESYRQSYLPNAYTPNSTSSNPPAPHSSPYNTYSYQSPYPPPYQYYYPPAMYAPVVPAQPPRKNRFGTGGGLGLGAGLLGGAVGGLLLGDVIGDMSYDTGYDQGFDGGMGHDWGGGF